MILDAYIGRLVTMVAIIIVQRRLGLDQFGVFSFARAFPAFFIIIADMGLEGISIREVSVKKELSKEFLGKTIPLKLFLMALSILTVSGALLISGKDSFTFKATLIMSFCIVGRTMMSFFMAVFKGHEKMNYVALTRIIEALSTFFFVIVLIRAGSMADTAVWAMFWSMVIALSVCSVILFKLVGGFPRLSIDIPYSKEIISQSWLIALGAVSIQIFASTDIVMLSFFSTNAIVGIYASCNLVLNIVSHSQSAISHAIFPVISKFFVSEKEALPKTYEKAFKLFSAIGLPICIGGIALAAPIMNALFDISSREATIVFIIVCASRIFTVYGAFYGTFVISIHQQKFFGATYSACALLNIVLNFILIPIYGMYGAALTTLLCNFLIIVLTYIYTLRPYDKFASGAFLLRISCCLLAMYCAIYLLHYAPPALISVLPPSISHISPSVLELIISIPGGSIAYFLSFFIFKPFSPDDIALVKKSFSQAKAK